MRAWVFITALACLGAATLPPEAEALREPIRAAEQRLQDATLELQVAKHDAEPLQDKVAEARQKAGSWWGSWLLKRRLGQLKASLDKVEAARAAQASARQDLALLLTGAEEELIAALESSLAATSKPNAASLEKWRAWWAQKRAWQLRLAALAPEDADVALAGGPESKRIRREAALAQAQREEALRFELRKFKALP